jgi:hypothetical protein
MRNAIVLCAALLTVPLQGCFFIWVPGSLIDAASDQISGDFGNFCIPSRLQTGDKVRMANGQMATVTRISGTSSRCTFAELPIRAQVTYD